MFTKKVSIISFQMFFQHQVRPRLRPLSSNLFQRRNFFWKILSVGLQSSRNIEFSKHLRMTRSKIKFLNPLRTPNLTNADTIGSTSLSRKHVSRMHVSPLYTYPAHNIKNNTYPDHSIEMPLIPTSKGYGRGYLMLGGG